MTINIIELPYQPCTVLNLFRSLSLTPWSMLLYSGYKNKHPEGRFDILVTDPILTLTTYNNITTISHNKNQITSNQDPLFLLQKYSKIFYLKPNYDYIDQIPFQGGYVGIFGYDLIKHIDKTLPKLSKPDTHLPDMAIGLYKWAIISDHKLNKNYLISHDNPDPILDWIHHYTDHDHNFEEPFKLLNTWTSNMNYTEYKKKFSIIKKHLTKGNCYQICLSQRFQAPYTGDTWIAFQHLLHYNQTPFTAFIKLSNHSSILSFSPERFLKLYNSNIKTQPIKGTLSRSKNIQDDHTQILKLSSSTKNQSENLMIVDLMRNDIGKVAIPGSIQVTKLFDIQTFPNIHHMVSTIIGKLDGKFSVYDLLRACFPGGSITGAPKIQAMKIIEKLEPTHRSIWSGSIGYISCCGNMDTNIAIRTLFTDRQNLFCSVGSGIVFDSHQESEYQEMQDKLYTLLNPLENQFLFKHKK